MRGKKLGKKAALRVVRKRKMTGKQDKSEPNDTAPEGEGSGTNKAEESKWTKKPRGRPPGKKPMEAEKKRIRKFLSKSTDDLRDKERKKEGQDDKVEDGSASTEMAAGKAETDKTDRENETRDGAEEVLSVKSDTIIKETLGEYVTERG